MPKKTYYRTVSVLFFIIAVVHLLRVVYGWGAVVNDIVVPFWVSWVVVLVAGYLAFEGFKFNKKS